MFVFKENARKHAELLPQANTENTEKSLRVEDFGLRWQSVAATPLSDCGTAFQSGVALRFPPQSKPSKVSPSSFYSTLCAGYSYLSPCGRQTRKSLSE
jgi:hypothetical protein